MFNREIFDWRKSLGISASGFLQQIEYNNSALSKAIEGIRGISPIWDAASSLSDTAKLFPRYSMPQIGLDYFNLNQIALDSQRLWFESLNPIKTLFDSNTYWLAIKEDAEAHSAEYMELEPHKKIEIPSPGLIWRISLELIQKVIQNPEILFQISDRDFEVLTGDLFHSSGFEVELTPKSKDGGKDLIVTRTDEMGLRSQYLVECKRFAAHRKVGVEIVRSLHGTVDQARANGGIIVTTSTFTKPAVEWASEFKSLLQLKDFNDLKTWLNRFKA